MKDLLYKLNIQLFADDDEEIIEDETKEEQKEKTPFEIIDDMKKNTVSKEKYAKLQKEYNDMLSAIANDEEIIIEGQPKEDDEATIDQLRKDLLVIDGPILDNLEYVKKALKLRELLIEKGERDPFLPNGRDYHESDYDEKEVEHVVEVLDYCVKNCNDNSTAFTGLLQSMMTDPIASKAKRR